MLFHLTLRPWFQPVEDHSMRLLTLLLSLLILPALSCSSAQQSTNSNTELVVTYNGVEEHRRGGDWVSHRQLRKLVDSNQELIIVFGAKWCKPCNLIKKAVKQANLRKKVYWVNVDKTWGAQLMTLLGSKDIPFMIHADKSGKIVATKHGAGAIVSYLVIRY